MALSSAQHPPLTSHQLLVSVQSAEEASVALSAGVDWIDLKDPTGGSLGRPVLATAQAVSELLSSGTRTVQRSIALGEWSDYEPQVAHQWMQHFPIVKLGLAGAQDRWPIEEGLLTGLRLQAEECGCQVVWAHYADWQTARAPSWDQVLKLIERFESPFVLIDTWQKKGRGLFSWVSPSELRQLRDQAAQLGATLVIAGSLRASDWPLLEQIPPCIIGVRGALCRSDSDRSTSLDAQRLDLWLQWIRSLNVPA